MRVFNEIKIGVALFFTLPAFASIDVKQSVVDMKVSSDGIYRITHADILELNINLTGVLTSQLAVYNNGEMIPAKIVTEKSNMFGAGSYIEFVGFTEETLYQSGSVYSLVLAQGSEIADQQINYRENQAAESYYLQTDIYNDNVEYSTGSAVADPWFAKRILAVGAPKSEVIDFELNNLVNSGNINLELSIWGGVDYLQSPDHHVIYKLNNNDLDDFWFDGVTAANRNYEINSNQLISGTQQLSITLPNDTNTDADVVHVESWKVTYPRAFVFDKQLDYTIAPNQAIDGDRLFASGFEIGVKNYMVQNAISEPYSIYKVLGNGDVSSYTSELIGDCSLAQNMNCSLKFTVDDETMGHLFIAAESDIKKPDLSVPVLLTEIKQLPVTDFLIVAHPDFIGPSLNEFIQLKSQEHNVSLIDVEQIYAQFGFHNVSASAIADYIRYIKMQNNIRNVLLVGGDSYDYKNYLGLNSVSFIPTLYTVTDTYVRFAPVDAKFADIDGDDVPDINIGRFPVRTEAELANLVQKIEDYSNKTYGGTSIFAADKYDNSQGYSFKDDAEFLINALPANWKANISDYNKAYIDNDGASLARSKIIDNINQGVALTSFIGHSGPRDWSRSGMFSANDALALENIVNPTVVTQWGCWNTYFVSPEEDTLAHAFMLNQNGGAASVLGASTLTKAAHERDLAQLVLNNLTEKQMSLGEAVTQAKRTYAVQKPDAIDVILGWNILGDPTLRL